MILVHGLWTPAAVFALHGNSLRRDGYRVLCFGYASVKATLTENAQQLSRLIATTDATEIHLIGHSLGGLIILDLLTQTTDPRVRRVLLLGTPCLGSDCARRLAALPGMPALLGRSIMQWLSRTASAPFLPQPGVEIGVLAGTRSLGLGRLLPGLPQPNDGVVALAETRLAGAADFLALPVAHSQMLASRRCAAQIASFLHSGRFQHGQQG